MKIDWSKYMDVNKTPEERILKDIESKINKDVNWVENVLNRTLLEITKEELVEHKEKYLSFIKKPYLTKSLKNSINYYSLQNN